MDDTDYTVQDFEEDQAADRLRQAKNRASLDYKSYFKEDRAKQAETAKSDPGQAGEKSLRQRLAAARKNLSAENLKNKAKEKVEEKVAAPIASATGRGLRWAWYNLIPSWGLSLIWINIHVFLRMVLGEKLFCKLGHEWIPKQVEAATGEAGETVGKAAGIVEVMILLMLDLIVLFIILAALGIIILIVNFMGLSWWEKLVALFSAIWNLGWNNFIKPIVELFINLYENK